MVSFLNLPAEVRAMIYELSLDEWCGDVTLPNLCKVHPQIQAALLPMRFKNERVKFYAYSCGFKAVNAPLSKHDYAVVGHFQLDELEALPAEAFPLLTKLQIGHYRCPHTQNRDADAVEYQAVNIDLIQEAAVGAEIPKIIEYEMDGVEKSAHPGMSHDIFCYAVNHLVPILDAILERDNPGLQLQDFYDILNLFTPVCWADTRHPDHPANL
ncbi:hypothetical protein BDV97DRAFT_365091 [Delphinella strobiligena]|nr:hypothetical protein BDV97DRAFT_365091 [Delphinella strobiligena]